MHRGEKVRHCTHEGYLNEKLFEHVPRRESDLFCLLDTTSEFMLWEKSTILTETDEYDTIDDPLGFFYDISILCLSIILPDIAHEFETERLVLFIEFL